jgi:hypothetical protein
LFFLLHNISISVLAQAPEICFGGIEDRNHSSHLHNGVLLRPLQ